MTATCVIPFLRNANLGPSAGLNFLCASREQFQPEWHLARSSRRARDRARRAGKTCQICHGRRSEHHQLGNVEVSPVQKVRFVTPCPTALIRIGPRRIYMDCGRKNHLAGLSSPSVLFSKPARTSRAGSESAAHPATATVSAQHSF
jgi:hypothetical protein